MSKFHHKKKHVKKHVKKKVVLVCKCWVKKKRKKPVRKPHHPCKH